MGDISIRDYKFSIFYDEIECYFYSAIRYIANRPPFIKNSEDLAVFTKINIDRKNGVINIHNNEYMIEFKADNLIKAINSNKAYYAFNDFDVELLYCKETKILEAILNGLDLSSKKYQTEVKDKSFSIIAFSSISIINDDEIVLLGKNVFSIKLFKAPKEVSFEFQKDIQKELESSLGSLVQKDPLFLSSSGVQESDIDKIAILACNNNWGDIFKAAITTETPTKRTLDTCMRASIKNGNIEIAKLCL
jgi:hypothetical protein